PLALDVEGANYPIDASRLAKAGTYYFRVTASAGIDNSSSVVGPIEVSQRPVLELDANTVSFGDVAIGDSGTGQITLRSTGVGTVTVNGIGGADAPFAVVDTRFPILIGGGQQMTLDVTFTPTTSGRFT